MTRDDIIRMAREAGLDAKVFQFYGIDEPRIRLDGLHWNGELERFAALVAAAERGKCGECGKASAEGWALYCVRCCEGSMVAAAVAAEREACAKVCDDTDVVRFWHGGMEHDDGNRTLGNAAAAIRARGDK